MGACLELRLAQHVVGNQLVIVHAVAILKEVFVQLGILTQENANRIIPDLTERFLHPPNLQVERRGPLLVLESEGIHAITHSPTQPMPGMRTVECHHAGTTAKLQGGIDDTIREVLETKGIPFDNWAIMRDSSRRIMLQPDERWGNINQPLHVFELTFCIVRSNRSS